MKKNKGFTLVELIGVITVLGVIVLITMPVVTGVVKKSKEQAYNKQVDTIVRVAKEWGVENSMELPDQYLGVKKTIELTTLIASGKIQNSSIIDPRDKEEMNGCVLVKYNRLYSQYEYSYNDESNRCILYGDVNVDGFINKDDYTLLLQYINDGNVTINEVASDLYEDNKINNKDLVILMRMIDWKVESNTTITVNLGDVNVDNVINYDDLSMLMKYLNGWDIQITVQGIYNADMNSDGLINNKDYSLLMQKINASLESTRKFGDVNVDGAVHQSDYELLMKYINGWGVVITSEGLANADINMDGELDNKDLALLMQIINGWEGYKVMLGDVNSDRVVNSYDYELLMEYVNCWDVQVDETASDMNSDGLINNKDISLLMQIVYWSKDNILYGDVNVDGKINSIDIDLLMKHVNGWTVTINENAADMNFDNKLDNLDIALLMQLVYWNKDVLYGDVNADDKITAADYEILTDYVNGHSVTINKNAADVNEDGELNNKDIGLIMQLVFWGKEGFLYGDVNRNGIVDVDDYNLLMEYVNGHSVTINVNAVDVNFDNTVNNKDLGILKQYISGWDIRIPV